MYKVLVTGASGLLGNSLVPVLAAHGHAVVRHGCASRDADFRADLTDFDATSAMLAAVRPDVIINLAALTNVDTCETAPDQAYRLNVLAVEHLCRAMRARTHRADVPQPHLIHISTDQVYDGAGPFAEHQVRICNTYAFSKLASELAAAGVGATVLRTNFFGRSRCRGRVSFSDWLHNALRAGDPINVFEDVAFSPLSMKTLTAMLALCVQARPAGVFNLGAHGGMSKADFAYAFAAAAGLPDSALTRVRLGDGAMLKAYRPRDMRMDSSLFERTLGVQLPALADEIISCGMDYREQT